MARQDDGDACRRHDGGKRGAGRNAHGDTFDLRNKPCGRKSSLISDANDVVDKGAVEVLRHETGTDSLNLVLSSRTARQDAKRCDLSRLLQKVRHALDFVGRRYHQLCDARIGATAACI